VTRIHILVTEATIIDDLKAVIKKKFDIGDDAHIQFANLNGMTVDSTVLSMPEAIGNTPENAIIVNVRILKLDKVIAENGAIILTSAILLGTFISDIDVTDSPGAGNIIQAISVTILLFAVFTAVIQIILMNRRTWRDSSTSILSVENIPTFAFMTAIFFYLVSFVAKLLQ